MPIASAIVLIVLAVNIAPQVPLPGITLRSSSSSSAAEIRPDSCGGPALGVVHDREVRALARPGAEGHLPGRAGARIEHQAERIGARERHQGGGAGLVAAGDHDHRIAVMGVVADLEAIGDDVARYQAVARRRRSLGQRVGHRRRADDQALPAAFGQDFDQQIGDAAHPIVAPMGVGLGGGDRDHGIGLGGAVRVEPGGPKFHPGFLPEGAAVLCHAGRLG